jgi:hypothetical protein
MTDHRKRLNSRTFIRAGVKELVYRIAENPRLAVIVERAIRPFCLLGQRLGWLTAYASDTANAEQFLGDVVNAWLVRRLASAVILTSRQPSPRRDTT